MANIDLSKLSTDMLAAIKGPLTEHWKEAKPFAEKEIKSFAANLKLIEDLKAKGKITEEQARLSVDIQKSAMRISLLTVQGLALLAVEAAINAAIDMVRSTINTALGWSIL